MDIMSTSGDNYGYAIVKAFVDKYNGRRLRYCAKNGTGKYNHK